MRRERMSSEHLAETARVPVPGKSITEGASIDEIFPPAEDDPRRIAAELDAEDTRILAWSAAGIGIALMTGYAIKKRLKK